MLFCSLAILGVSAIQVIFLGGIGGTQKRCTFSSSQSQPEYQSPSYDLSIVKPSIELERAQEFGHAGKRLVDKSREAGWQASHQPRKRESSR